MSRPRSIAAALVTIVSLTVPTLAIASPTVPWGGVGANDLGPATLLLSVTHGRVTVRNVQMVLACTDTETGSTFDQAWYASSNHSGTLRLNRYTTTLTADAGGYEGAARVSGTLGSNGRGTSQIDTNAIARDHTGRVIARCSGRAVVRLRRP